MVVRNGPADFGWSDISGRIEAMDIADPLQFLLGAWSITRSIDDHQSGDSGTFEGSAVFTETEVDGDFGRVTKASYEESGELRLGSHTSEAHRRLEYRAPRCGAVVDVFLSDGSPFIHLDLSSGTWQGVHLCGDDRQEISITVPTGNEFRELWRVRGPETDYEAITIFHRLVAPLRPPGSLPPS
jgi:Family of unknown function (DUF6314)